MQTIQEQALATYQKNIHYLQQKHPHIIELLNILDTAIQKGDYQEQFSLEYVNDNFDLVETATQHYLYNKESTALSEKLAKELTYDKNHSSIEAIPLEYVKEGRKYTDITQSRKGLHPVMRYYIENTIHKDLTTAKQIRKYIFLGTGLGLHIPKIHEKIKALNYLVIEDNLELFKLSLFTCDYAAIAKTANLYFSIAASKEEFMQTFSTFMQESFFDNRYLKYTHFPLHSQEKIKYMQHIIATNKIIVFSYRSVLSNLIRPLEYLHDGSYILNLADKFKNTVFEKTPVLMLGAGPSLQKNIEWLKENQNRFIIVAVSAALPLLYKYDIKPDILTHIDGYEAASVHFEGIDAEQFLHESIAVLGSFAPLSVRRLFKPENIFTTQDPLTQYFSSFANVPTACVGSFTFNLALQLNPKELYMLGLDLALDQETGATHAKEHAKSSTLDISKAESLNSITHIRKNILKARGNFSPEVVTTSLLYASFEAIDTFIAQTKFPKQTIYNLGDGVKFSNTKPLRTTECKLQKVLQKDSLKKEIHNALREHATKELSKADRDLLVKRLTAGKETKALVDNFANKKYANSELFIYALSQLYISILQKNSQTEKHLAYVYVNFLEYLLPIVIDYFNTKGLKNQKKDIKQLQKMIAQELYTIEKIHTDALQKFCIDKLQSKE